MNLKLHHVNLCSKDVPAMDEFYRSVLGLEPEPPLSDTRLTAQGYSGNVAFLSDGQTQVQIREPILGTYIRV